MPLGNGVKGFVRVDEATVKLTRKGSYIGDRLSKQHCRLHVHLPFVGQAIVLQLKKRNESVRCLSDREAFLRTLPGGYSIIEVHCKGFMINFIGPQTSETAYPVNDSKFGTAKGAFHVSTSGTKFNISTVSFMKSRSLK